MLLGIEKIPYIDNGGELMGWKLARLDVCELKPNEEKDVCIILKEEKRAVIHGEVKFPNGKPVENAAVKLFRKKKFKDCDYCELTPVTFTFTDECGQFLFGVESFAEYVIKVFYYKPEKPWDPCEKDAFDHDDLMKDFIEDKE